MKVKSIFTIFGILLFLCTGLLIFGSLYNSNMQPQLIPILIGGTFGIILLGLLIYWLFGVITRRAIGAPIIEVSPTTLRVGETFSVTCQQTFKRNANVTGIKIALIRREIAKYTRGTDTETVIFNHMVQESEEPGRVFNAGKPFYSQTAGKFRRMKCTRLKVETILSNGW